MRLLFRGFAALALLLTSLAGAQEAATPAAQPQAAAVAAPQPEGLRLVLPAELWAVPGRELNLYFDNVVLARDLRSLVFDVDCTKGRQDEERWRFTPAETDVGDYELTLRVLDAQMLPLAEGKSTLHVVPASAGAGTSFTLLCVGDSLTNASIYPQELWALFGMEGEAKLKLIGTHHPIAAMPPEVVHEGYGGWAWQTFCTRWTAGTDAKAKSPFLTLVDGNPTLDFAKYCEANNDAKAPDFITVLLGCNDTFGANEATIETTIDTMFGYADTLLAEFRRVGPQTRIGLLLLPPPAATQDAFGTNYNCGQTRWQYRRNQHRVVERMTARFGGREAEGIWLLPAHVNLDTVNNYPTVTGPANARSQVQVARLNNGVHPSADGYRQIADTIYCWLKAQLATRPEAPQ